MNRILSLFNSYGRLAKVSMELIVDDAVSAEAFCKRLGKELKQNRKWSNTEGHFDRTGDSA
jgi:hypothetical protein